MTEQHNVSTPGASTRALPPSLPRGIRPRGDSYQVDVSYRGTRRTGTAPNLEDAILLRRRLRGELTGEPVVGLPVKPQAAWTIKKAIEVTEKVAWRDSAWGVHASHNARELAKFLGQDAPLDTIDTTTLDDWSAELADQGKTDSTINRYLAAVSKVFTVAQERGGVATKPKFPRRKEAQGRIRFLSADEEAGMLKLFEGLGKRGERDLFVLLIDTGLRMGEALRLEVRDLDFRSGIISVWRTKNDMPRSVPMTKRVRDVLERAAAVRPAGPVIAVSRHEFRQTWDRAKAELGLSWDRQFVPHALRHTCASRLVQRGVPLKVVQEWIGHKSITVTMRYAHLAPANLLAAVSVLERDAEAA